MAFDAAGALAASEGDETAAAELHAEITALIGGSEFEVVGGLGAELVRLAATQQGPVNVRAVFALDHLFRTLGSTSGTAGLQTLLRLIALPAMDEIAGPPSARTLAAIVAHHHSASDLTSLGFSGALRSSYQYEFSACLVQELLLVGVEVAELPEIISFTRALRADGHPLAVLPLTLMPEELGVRRPSGASRNWTWTISATPVMAPAGLCSTPLPPLRGDAEEIDFAEVGDETFVRASGCVVAHWRAESNGKVAGQEFRCTDPVAQSTFPAVFSRLPLEPWPEAEGAARPLRPATPDTVYRVLLTAAVRSPAYGRGLHGAYGRLATWQSLAGLVGAPTVLPIEQTAELVRRATWWTIEPKSPWFHQVAWDLAVAVLRPDGHGIAMLAATDTD
ncbi:DUF6183 family protein [Kitasatospora sp. NPDC004531]